MRFCPNCQTQFDNYATHCSQCGSILYEYVDATQPTYAPPKANEPSKARVIVGMIMSLCGLEGGVVSAMITGYLSVMFFAIAVLTGDMEAMGAGLIIAMLYGLFFGIFSTPFSIVGLVMSKKSIAMGSQSKMCAIGKKTGIIGLLLNLIPAAISLTMILAAGAA